MHRGRLVLAQLLFALGVLLCAGAAAAEPICGNDVCQAEENCGNCWQDCRCRQDQGCYDGICECPEGSFEEGGMCVDGCDKSSCMQWNPEAHACAFWCDPQQEWVPIDNVPYCKPKCSPERCEERDPTTHECKDICPAQGKVCVSGSCECPQRLLGAVEVAGRPRLGRSGVEVRPRAGEATELLLAIPG